MRSLLEIAAGALKAARWQAVLQVVALGVGLGVAGSVVTLREALAPVALQGTGCSERAGTLVGRDRAGVLRDAWTPAEADQIARVLDGAGLRAVQMVRINARLETGGRGSDALVGLVGPDFFQALCVRGAPADFNEGIVLSRASDTAAQGAAFASRAAVGSYLARVVARPGVFVGLRPDDAPEAAWVPLAHGRAAGWDVAASGSVKLLVAPLGDGDGGDVDQGLASIGHAGGAVPGVVRFERIANYELTATRAQQVERYSSLLLVLGVVLLALVLTNVAIYHSGRAALVSGLMSTLVALGARRVHRIVFLGFEPAVISAAAFGVGAAVGAALCAALGRMIWGEGADGLDEGLFKAAVTVSVLAALIAAATTAWRERTTRQSARPNKLLAARKAASLAPWLLVVQVGASVVCLAVAVQGVVGFVRVLPPAPHYDMTDVSMTRVINIAGGNSDPVFAIAWRSSHLRSMVPSGATVAYGSNTLPVWGGGASLARARVAGRTVELKHNTVTHEWFDVLQLPIAGRVWVAGSEPDARGAPPSEVVLNREAVALLWPAGAPTDMVIEIQTERMAVENAWSVAKVVGTVDEGSSGVGLAGDPRALGGVVYSPMVGDLVGALLVRSGPDRSDQATAITRMAHTLMPRSEVRPARALEAVYADAIAAERHAGWLLGAIAAGAVATAVFGVLSMAMGMLVMMRTEIAVRFATGASARAVRRAVQNVLGVPIAVGALIGIAPAWWAGHQVTALLPSAPHGSLAAVVAGASLLAACVVVLRGRVAAIGPAMALPWLRRE